MESFHLHNRRGFTLIELLVVLAIIGIIMAIIFTSQSTFNKTLILTNTAYDIALTLHDAETYGLGSRGAGATANAGYGVDFQTGNSFTLFADTYPTPSTSSVCHPTTDVTLPSALPGNCAYDASQGEKILSYTIGNNITIKDFCAYTNGGESCAVAHGGGLTSLDIVFSRPNPSVFISTNGSYNASYQSACITVTSPQGGFKYVSVAQSGEITANAAPCL